MNKNMSVSQLLISRVRSDWDGSVGKKRRCVGNPITYHSLYVVSGVF